MKKIVLFGDSIFNGYINGRNTDRVVKALNTVTKNQYDIENISMSGATTDDALDFIDKKLDPAADLVILWYGSNDAATDWGIPLKNYQRNLKALIKIIGAKKMLMIGPSSPDFENPAEGQFYDLDRYKTFDHACQEIASNHQIPFLDMFKIMRSNKSVKNLLLPDGIHYADQGIDLLVKYLAPMIEQKMTV